MTFAQLAHYLKGLSPEQMKMDVSIYDELTDECIGLTRIGFDDSDVLDDGCPVLVIGEGEY
ncbi:hypothetical protein UFOVP26_47 [uncultured Caudovirales phage]|uniref:Uncharacterized protein n=1 Tax=uncultured Caudovirales phage TaxID=2100421 RepID=A0A6J5KP72_9CAUD|nr:hypothetical protein UFOVP26_47 [uncultured Caudovirales phage]CAB4123763.1 hypothetical protein UFOVP44_50 [uncultured Caudovirales phage]CAB5219172.1 hypothetical protein UFOVP220_41 [uncultured Caudovirales phage]